MAESAALATAGFAASVGVATFFAPCAYPLLPGYVGYYLSQEDADLTGAAIRGLAATLGALAVLGAFSAVLVVAGGSLVGRVAWLEPAVGAALVVLGALVLTDRAPEVRLSLPARRRSVAGFALFGGVYALAAAGCVVPLTVSVVFEAVALSPAGAAVALAAYALAAALPLFGVTLAASAGSDLLRSASRHVGTVRRGAGAVMVLAGLAQIARSLSYLGLV